MALPKHSTTAGAEAEAERGTIALGRDCHVDIEIVSKLSCMYSTVPAT